MSVTYKCPCQKCSVTVEGPMMGSFYCHCNGCRDASGAPFINGLIWMNDKVKPEGEYTQHETYKDADGKSTGTTTHRCKACGYFMYRTTKCPDLSTPGPVMVPRNSFPADDPQWDATSHVCLAFKVPHLVVPHDGLPRYNGFTPEFGGTEGEWRSERTNAAGFGI